MPTPRYGYNRYDTSWTRSLPRFGYSAGYGVPPSDIYPQYTLPREDEVPPTPGIADYAAQIGNTVLGGLGYVMAPLGYAKRGVDWIARESARAQGLNVPDEWGVGKMLEEALIPMDRGRGGLLDYAAQIPGLAGVVRPVTENDVPRAIASGITRFAGDIGLDPLTYVGVPGLSVASRGRTTAAKLLAEQPGLSLYAPEVAKALGSAVEAPGTAFRTALGATAQSAEPNILAAAKAMGMSPETLTRFGLGAEKVAHNVILGSMAAGGAQTLAGAGRKFAGEGFTPEVAYEAVQGLGEVGLAGLGALGHAKGKRQRAEALVQAERFRPTRVLPIDSLPDRLQEEAEYQARDLAEALVAGKGQEAMDALPDHLRPYAPAIWAQAREESQWVKGGRELLDKLQQEHEKGAEGVTEERGPDGSVRVIQRNKAGEIVGGAQAKDGYLEMIAGGRAMGAKESVRPIYEKLDELGIQRVDMTDTLSPQGALARRRAAEQEIPRQVLEGSVTPVEAKEAINEARKQFEGAGLGDLLGAPAYSVDRASRAGAQPFYSQLRRVVDDPKVQAKQTGEQWSRYLSDPKRGVKADELEWTGLADFLAARKGTAVTREEVQQHLDSNEVRVDEVELGGAGETPSITVRESAIPGETFVGPEQRGVYRGVGGTVAQLPHSGGFIVKSPMARHLAGMIYQTHDEALAALRPLVDQATTEIAQTYGGPDTRFKEYALPGGENYRELLLTLPRGEANDPVLVRAEKLAQASGEDWEALGPNGRERFIYQAERTTPGVFHAPHFGETPNILAHIRFNERKGPSGERVLFVEEIQSDWAQKGREQGFRPRPGEETSSRKEWDALQSELQAKYGRVPLIDELTPEEGAKREALDEAMSQTEEGLQIVSRQADTNYVDFITEMNLKYHDKLVAFVPRPWRELMEPADLSRFERLLQEKAVAINNIKGAQGKVPRAPFVGDTGKWTELAVKRVLKYAADNGYDKVSWTTGEQQVARYDLSKQLSRIDVSEMTAGGGLLVEGYDRDGVRSIDRETTAAGLPTLIGKELADRAIAGMPETRDHAMSFTGLDLKVGGHGMKAFYDEILPQVVSKVGKRLGLRVGKSEVGFPPKFGEEMVVVDAPDISPEEMWSRFTQAKSTGEDTETGGRLEQRVDGGFDFPVRIQQQARDVYRAMLGDLRARAFPGVTTFGAVPGVTFSEALRTHGSTALAEILGAKMSLEKPLKPTEVGTVAFTSEAREKVKAEGFPLFAVGKEGRAAAKQNVTKLLLKLYPEGSKITERDGHYEVQLPDKRVVRWRPEKDHIAIDLGAFEKGYGREATPEERAAGAAGVTYRLPNAAVVEMVTGAAPRIPLHEHWHVVKHLGTLSKRQAEILQKRFGGDEEKEADAYADWFESGMKKPDTIWQRIHQGIRNLYESVSGSEAAVFREATKELGAKRAPARPTDMSRQPGEWWKRMWGPEGPLAKQRAMKGEDTKRAVGAPPGINTGADFMGLKDELKTMAHQGAVARPWYRNSSQMILNAVGGNKVDAEKIAQLVAIYSSQTPVPANIEAAFRAWNQYKAGATQLASGRNRSMDRRAEDLLFKGKNWEGRKTNNFYGNLMLQIDPTNPILKDLVTVDVHMMRAIGYNTDSPAEQQYRWAEKLFKDIAHDLGWEAHEVQAAVWTAQKYRREVLSKLKPGEAPPPIANFDFADAAREQVGHVNLEAVPHPTTGVLPELQTAGFEMRQAYTQGIRERVLFDAEGHDRVAMLLGIPTQGGFLAPGYYKGRLEPGFKSEVAMTPEVGGIYAAFREMGYGDWDITKALKGGPKATLDLSSPLRIRRGMAPRGFYLDRAQRQLYMDPSLPEAVRQQMAVTALGELSGKPEASQHAYDRARELDPYTKKQMERYAAIMGFVLRQEGVGYGRTFTARKQAEANAYHIDIGRQLTGAETESLMEAIAKKLGTTVEDPSIVDIFPKTKRDGVTVVNFSNRDNAEVLKAVAKAGKELFVDTVVNSGYAREVGGLVSNGWAQNPNGEEYARLFADEAAAGGSPDLLRGVERLRQEADAYNRTFAEQQGWGGAARTAATSAAEVAGGPRAGVIEPPSVRGPPVPEAKYAVHSPPIPPTGEAPMGQPKPPGQPPRVEERVESLEKAVAEQRALGILTPDLNLNRMHRRTWKSLDPAVRDKLANWSDDEIFARMKRGALDDVEVQALDAVVRGRREAKELARQEFLSAKGTEGEDVAWRNYAQSIANFLPLERANVNDGTGTARALAARARLMEAAQTTDRQFLKRVFRELPDVDDHAANEMLRMFESGDPKLADAIRAATAGRWKQWQTLLRAFLITPSSEIANTLGNTIVQGIEVADTGAAAGIDWLVSALRGTRRERYLGEVGAEVGGMLEAVPGAVETFLKERFVNIYKRAWSGESSKAIDPSRRLEYQVSPFKSRLGRLFGTSLDALQAGDELFQAPIAQGELAKRAFRAAKNALPVGTPIERVQADALEIMAEVVRRPEKHPEMINAIRSSTERRLFRGKPWHVVEVIKNLDRRYPWLSAIMPFVKTPANIARYAIHHSPLGFFTPEAGRALEKLVANKGEMTQGQASDIVAQRLVGTVVFGMAVGAAKAGKLTGSGPADPKERNALQETGWRPYSIIVNTPTGKVYVPYNRFDPVAQMVGVAADIVELPNMRDANDIASKAIGSIAENFTNRTYLKGLIDFTEALNDPLRFAGNYAIGIGEMHIPRISARVAQAIDPVLRDVRPTERGPSGFMQRVVMSAQRNVPGLSQMLPARYGPAGEPIVRPGEGIAGGLMRALSPVQISPERKGRDLEGLMAQIGYVPTDPAKFMTVSGQQIALDREHLEKLHQADRVAAYELRQMLANPLFNRLPDTIEEGGEHSKEGLIRKVYNKHRDLARQQILKSWTFQKSARAQLLEARMRQAQARGISP